MEINRGAPSSKKSMRATKLWAKATDASVRSESTVFGRYAEEELGMLQLNESMPYVGIDNIRRAMRAE